MLSGQPSACVGINLNGPWLVKGNTASGRPWYTHKITDSESKLAYMYFDPDCAWDDDLQQGGFGAAWVISTSPPDLEASFNLSGKKDCQNIAHTVRETKVTRPPSVVEWDMTCWSSGKVHSNPLRWRLGISDRPFPHEVE